MIRVLALLSLSLLAQGASVPDHAIWDSIVRAYVTPESLVNYVALKQNAQPQLDRYVAMLARKWPDSMTQPGRKAALINAYNALMIRWVLDNYPVESVWRTKRPFTEARHNVDGKKMSLDDIETTLRNMGDPRIHAAIVCASRGCPPLRREAYIEGRLEAQLDDSTRSWLANPKRNQFFPDRRLAEVNPIFKWYRGDFEKSGGSVRSFLAKYAPPQNAFLKQPQVTIRYKSYHWGLNDSSSLGSSYSYANFLLDAGRNK
jgi:hypothetical protein